MKAFKQYYISTVYRGYQIHKTCMAHSFKEAAEKFEVTLSFARGYASSVRPNDEHFDGVNAQIDSGYIPFEYGRTDLLRLWMPLDELKTIIDHYNDIKYNKNS